MIESGMATVQYQLTFAEQRLGMVLADGEEGGVQVLAFTELDGELGPAEMSGKVAVGDQLTRVNGRSVRDLNYAAVLDIVIGAHEVARLHPIRLRPTPQPTLPHPTPQRPSARSLSTSSAVAQSRRRRSSSGSRTEIGRRAVL